MNFSQVDTKEANVIIKFILDKKNCASRKEILEIVPWGSSKTDKIIRSLRDSNILQIRNDNQKTYKRGRAENFYAVNSSLGLFLGVELNNHFDRFALTDFAGNLLMTKEFPASFRTDEVETSILNHTRKFLAKLPKQESAPILGATLALHGLFHETQGQLLQPMDSESTINLNIRDLIKEHFGIPTSIRHPRDLLLLEKFGFEKYYIKDKLVLSLIQANGVGLGISIRGEYISGTTNLAGEIGHITVPGNPLKCYCGKEGCLRTIVSYRGIVELVIQRIKENHATSLSLENLEKEPYEKSVERIIEASLAKDTLSMMIIHDVGELLGSSIAKAVNLLNPDLLVINSNLMKAKETFRSPLLYRLQTEALPKSIQNLEIEFSAFPQFGIASGAAKQAQLLFLNNGGLAK